MQHAILQSLAHVQGCCDAKIQMALGLELHVV